MTNSGKIAGADDIAPDRFSFANHAFVKFRGNIYDATTGPNTGTRSEAQYVSDIIDTSTEPEEEEAGDRTDIQTGGVSNVQ